MRVNLGLYTHGCNIPTESEEKDSFPFSEGQR